MAIDMNRLSLNSDGALRTTMQSRIPHTSTTISTATVKIFIVVFNRILKLIIIIVMISKAVFSDAVCIIPLLWDNV